MTGCIVAGCSHPAAEFRPLIGGALVDYCEVHAREWMMAEEDAAADRADRADDWARDARIDRETEAAW